MSGGSLASGNLSPTSPTYNFNKTPKLSPAHSRHSPSPLLKSPHQTKDPYDFLTPQGFLKPRQPRSNTDNKEDDAYVILRPSSEIGRRTSLKGPSNNVYSQPLPPSVLSHTYEYLPPLPKDNEMKKKKEEQEGFESYIFMAPRSDLNTKPPQPAITPSTPLKFSPVKKGRGTTG